MTQDEWSRPTQERLSHAKSQALEALSPERSGWRLRRYYDAAGDYAGASFVSMGMNDPRVIAPDDLFAVTLLSVGVPAGAARLLTEEGETKEAVNEALRALATASLQHVDEDGLHDMEVFYRHVKKALAKARVENSNPWVTASKLCARKRPDLFPVRDNVVCELLGLLPKGDYQVDWQVFRHLMADSEILDAIAMATGAATEGTDGSVLVVDQEPLRVLDAALWSSVMMPDRSGAPA
ncbi:hypothetical protein GCM10009868_26390 [Terrabacter aerolatus]|uniref:Uncharacterized protein n=1 Tax=Terrabacter aerolatus TaxID=422442 RepID=A0A512D5E9_9MICO|nr:DUF6308 family protein [Terrabacter aerolatus]GEO31689.1 hypothetical protein TAE01_34990 [Terrabacter aerolatus]